MAEAVAVPKPAVAKSGTGKTVFAGVVVFILLVAFATAFYFLGGADLVAGLIDSWFASAPPASSSQPPNKSTGAPAVVPTASAEPSETAGLQLPEGVDEEFADRVYAEQLESQANIQKLVDGDVVRFDLGKVKVEGDKATIPVTATFKDKTKGPGTMELDRKGGKWYLAWIAGDPTGNRKGLADTVSRGVDENSPEHLAQIEAVTVDEAVVSTMLQQQAANQDVISAIVDGTYTSFTCDGVTPGPGTASIDVTFSGPAKASMKGRALCISKDIDGTKWFLTSFTKS